MNPALYFAETPGYCGRIAISGRPRGGAALDHDVASWRARGVDVVVSLMAEDEAARLGLADEGLVCGRHGITWMSLPIADFTVPPSIDVAVPTIERTAAAMTAGKGVVFHCYAGRGRSPTLAACTLVHRGMAPLDAIDRLSIARGHPIPETAAQRQWIVDFAATR